jgi:mannose/fructose-specific phosphotransferase system component IIA
MTQQNQQNQQTGQTQQPTPTQTGNDPIQGFLSDIFGGTLKNAAMLAI